MRAEYFAKPDSFYFSENYQKYITYEPNVDNNWGMGSPNSYVGPDDFLVRWGAILSEQDASYGRGYVYLPVGGDWTFCIQIDDGGRLYVDNQLIIDDWRNGSSRMLCSTVNKAAGWYPIEMQYYEAGQMAVARLYFQGPPGSGFETRQIIPSTNLRSCFPDTALDSNPPTCTLSGPTSVTVNTSVTYTATGSDAEGNLNEVEIWKSPTSNQTWTNVVDGCSGPTCQGTTSFDTEGTYYVSCNAFDTAGNKCSANPWCEWEPNPPDTDNCAATGWADCTANDLLTVTVTPAGPWWQVQDADVTTNGDLVSLIPSSCTLPACDPVFGLKGPGGYPGVPSYGSSADYDFAAETGNKGSASEDPPFGWLAQTDSVFTRVYDYEFFEKMISSSTQINELQSNTINSGDLTSGVKSGGYYWYHFDGSTYGDLTINSNINLTGDSKVILLVDGADLYINGRINLVDGQGFFMAIVGKTDSGTKGNIFVDPSVAHNTQVELEGLFLAEGQFRTGAGNEQLHIRGSVAAYDGLVLERDLDDNSQTPAELIEYAPDLIFTFPRELMVRRYRWKEVAP